MVVLVLSACPPGLRGYLTRWLIEVSAGVFVGRVSKRVRELLWDKTTSMVASGRAILVFSARNEQRLRFETHGHHWHPVDCDGITLIMRPNEGGKDPSSPSRTGWSNAAKRRRYGSRL